MALWDGVPRRAERLMAPLSSPSEQAACTRLARVLLDHAPGAGTLRPAVAGWCGEEPTLAAWLSGREMQGEEEIVVAIREAAVAADGMAEIGAAVLVAAADAWLARARVADAVAAARLEALRAFAYGAGHEINNPLANIATRAQALLLDEQDPERRRRLATIVDQAFRARDMIGGLMVFARPPRPAAAAVAVDELVAGALEALRGVAETRGLRFAYSPSPQPVTAWVDAAQVAEALRLLVMNACEASAEGGRVTLAASGGPAGGRCQIVVADEGRGMDGEARRAAFDPFYSGREAGRGLGLGLPKAWRLIDVNGGVVEVDSRPGHGTRVVVGLPAAVNVSPACPV